MERELGRLATQHEGGRNHALNRSAFALAQLAAGGELDEAHARAELERVAMLIGLEPHETAATIESGWAAGEAGAAPGSRARRRAHHAERPGGRPRDG
jgi:putative DNA primase/helicase